MLPLRLLPEAKADFDQAVDWYGERGTYLAVDFIAKVRAVLQRIARHPKLHGIVYQDIRKAVVKRFPYVVVYREEETEVIVVAIFHSSRNDEIWKSRL